MKTLETSKRIALKNILFATDFSPYSNAALPYALAIARQYGAKLFGAHVVPSEDYLFTAPESWPAHIQREEQLEQEVAARLEEQLRGVQHEVLFGVGDVWKVLARLISEHDIDLIVVGTHGRTGARKLLMGSVAEKIFRQAACPVLSVGPNVSCKPDGGDSISANSVRNRFWERIFGCATLCHLPGRGRSGTTGYCSTWSSNPPRASWTWRKSRTSVMRRLKELVPPEAAAWCRRGISGRVRPPPAVRSPGGADSGNRQRADGRFDCSRCAPDAWSGEPRLPTWPTPRPSTLWRMLRVLCLRFAVELKDGT